jgi:membrane protease YdiL (CAAX protease family)
VISAVGAGAWTALIGTNLATTPRVPWAIPTMAVVLWSMWQYLGGRGWPGTTSSSRHALLRAKRVSRPVLAWSLLAGACSVVALAGFWIVLVDLVGVGGNPTIPDYARYPPLTVVLGLLMGSLVSPLTEEAAFRGYAQVRLERAFPAWAAIGIASVLFSLWHGPTQGFVWPKLLFYAVVGVAFGVTATLTDSTLPAIPAHILGDITFFFLVWPNDAARPVVWRDGADAWFAVHVVQMVVFTGLAILSFRRLARLGSATRVPGTQAQA